MAAYRLLGCDFGEQTDRSRKGKCYVDYDGILTFRISFFLRLAAQVLLIQAGIDLGDRHFFFFFSFPSFII